MDLRRRGISVKRYPSCVLAVLAVIAGCEGEGSRVTYVCDEPLDKYLDLARVNIANDYEVERSRQVLTTCPEKGFHRRYTFDFSRSALLSSQPVEARVEAWWCNDPRERESEASLRISPSTLTFQFAYPWPAATGKYPRTEFRLDRKSLRGGFGDRLNWSCQLEQAE